MNIRDKFDNLAEILKLHGVAFAQKEAEILITEALKISKSSIYADAVTLTAEQSLNLDKLVKRRIDGEPLQYILGNVEFMSLKIHVGQGVLIPRPETELLAEEAIKILSKNSLKKERLSIVDLCTGSGCLALALAKAFDNADVYGVDISDAALSYANKNSDENNIRNVKFLQGDLFVPVGGMSFDCIVSNPPYIKTSEINGLQREIKNHEPIAALDGGQDGLDFYRAIIGQARRYLNDNGLIILEIGFDQAEDVHTIALCSDFSDVSFIKDYSGFKRICIIKK